MMFSEAFKKFIQSTALGIALLTASTQVNATTQTISFTASNPSVEWTSLDFVGFTSSSTISGTFTYENNWNPFYEQLPWQHQQANAQFGGTLSLTIDGNSITTYNAGGEFQVSDYGPYGEVDNYLYGLSFWADFGSTEPYNWFNFDLNMVNPDNYLGFQLNKENFSSLTSSDFVINHMGYTVLYNLISTPPDYDVLPWQYDVLFWQIDSVTNGSSPSPVPVPASFWLLGSALTGLGLLSKNRSTKSLA